MSVARPSRLGNPYRVGPCSRTECTDLIRGKHWHVYTPAGTTSGTYVTKVDAQAAAVELFETHVLPDLDVSKARGRDVACYCRPGEPCHGDPIMRKANGGDS